MSPGPPTLMVNRTLLQESVRRLRRTGKESIAPVCLEFVEESFIISWAGSSEQVPAEGQWPGATYVPAAWLRALSKVFPAADPVTIRVEGGRVVTGAFACSIVDPGEQAELFNAKDRARRISKAVAALKAFRVGEDDIEHIVDRAELEGRRRYLPDEDRLLKSVAEAWVSLAVFGVSTEEIYRTIQQHIRNAWDTGGARD